MAGEREGAHLDPLRLDLPAIHEAIRAGKGDESWMQGWLASTYAAPERFADALHAYAPGKRGAPLKSRANETYDLYYDLVLAQIGRRKTAIAAKEDGVWDDATYESLHTRASSLAAAWERAGVVPGQTVCIVAPVGVPYTAAILAGFRLGLVVSALPPVGPTFVRARLEAIAPDHVAASDRAKPMLGRFVTQTIPLEATGRDTSPQTSYAYPPDAIALRLVSPMREEGPRVFDLPASRVHRGLLRDALLVYALDASDVLAAPGFDPLQHQPQLVLTALMAGASWAEIDVKEIEADPRALDPARVTTLGVKRSLRAHLVSRGVDPFRGCRAWFRSLSEVLDVTAWDDLARVFSEKKVPGFQVLANAASGGAVLFGQRKMGVLGLQAWPVPGETWQLSEVAAGTLPALNDAGVYTLLRGEEEDESLARFVMGRLGDSYVFSGSIDIGPDAQAYPCKDLATIAERHPGVRHAAAIVAAGRWVNDAKIVLILFTEPQRDDEGRLAARVFAQELRPLLVREMGEGRLPARIEVFPLRPRIRDGEVDVSWCRSQYLSGALIAKSRSDLFVHLAELAYIFAGDPPPPKIEGARRRTGSWQRWWRPVRSCNARWGSPRRR